MKEVIIEERDKAIKKAGKKAKEVEDKMGPLIEEVFEYLSEDILVEMLLERIKVPECAAGVIIDNLASDRYKNELIAIKVILKALK